jgi:predicted MFS family arabinose efflux permease
MSRKRIASIGTVGNNVNSPIRTSAIGLLQYLQLLYLPSELDIDEQIQQVTLYFYCMQYQYHPVIPTIAMASIQSPVESSIVETQHSESNESAYAAVFSLMETPRVLTALFGCCVQATLFSTFDTVRPLLIHALFGWGSLGSGLIFLAFLIPSFASPVVGWANDKLGPKWITCVGFLLYFSAFVLLREVTHDGIHQIVLLCALPAIIGFGVNFIGIPLAAEISYAIEANEEKRPERYGAKEAYAQGYELLNSGFATGTLIGPIWSGYVVTQSGWGTLGWNSGLLCALATIPTMIWTGGKLKKTGDRAEA